MRKTPLEKLNTREIALPNKRATKLIRFILKHAQKGADVGYEYSFDTSQTYGKQVILIADHATKDAYKYVLHGYPFIDPNVVIGYQNIFIKGLFGLLLKGGIIPKKLYTADQKSVTEMLRVLKMGGSLCIFPEGIQSSSGSTHPIFSGTAKMLKLAGVPVVLCKSYGSYLVSPRYKHRMPKNNGRQEFHYQILFTERDLKALSVDEIDARLLQAFRYNDFEWNKVAMNKYTPPKNHTLAEGLENILYRCPKCGGEFTLKTVGEHILCESCGNDIALDEYYRISPATEKDYLPYSSIDDWYKHQRKLVGEEVKGEFLYRYECEAFDVHTEKLHSDSFYPCGEGVITITNEKISYEGTRHNREVNIDFDVKAIPSFVFTPNQDNDFYYEDVYYSFRPKTDRKKVVKYMLLVEEAHRLLNPTWDKISKEVYED